MAPRIEPMPPITTTANTTMMMFEPISGVICTAERGEHAGKPGERDAETVTSA